MKKFLFSVIVFLLPIFSFADLPGGGVRWHTGFSISNMSDFPGYTFFYGWNGDTAIVTENKIYTFEHPGSPNVDWGIAVFAKEKSSGHISKPFFVGTNNMIDVVSIKSISADSVSVQVNKSPYTDQSDISTSNTDNPGDKGDDDSNAGHASTGFIKYLLAGISVAGIIILLSVLFIQKKNKN